MTVFIIRCNFAMLPACNFISLLLHVAVTIVFRVRLRVAVGPFVFSHDCSLEYQDACRQCQETYPATAQQPLCRGGGEYEPGGEGKEKDAIERKRVVFGGLHAAIAGIRADTLRDDVIQQRVNGCGDEE